MFNGKSDVVAQRESITGLTDPMWYKLKTGRWRGAVLVEADGQAWLCAAGLRREGEATDFYAAFMADVLANGPRKFMPTAEDRARLALELAEQRLFDWEVRIHSLATECFLAAFVVGASSMLVNGVRDQSAVIMDAEVCVEVIKDGDDASANLAEVVVTVTRKDWRSSGLAEHADSIILSAIQQEEQAWDVSPSPNGLTYSLLMSEEELTALTQSVDSSAAPCQSKPGSIAHYAHKQRLTESSVEGIAVRGLCGVWFVPRQDHKSLSRCPACDAIYQTLPSR